MNDDVPRGDWTIDETRDWLWVRIEDGAVCPVCEQFAKIYYRKINSTMTLALRTLYRFTQGGNFTQASKLPGDTHEMSQFLWWEMVEDEKRIREDGWRAGYYRIAKKGVDWLHERISVPEFARIYDARLLELMGDPYWLADAVKNPFNFRKLMEGPTWKNDEDNDGEDDGEDE